MSVGLMRFVIWIDDVTFRSCGVTRECVQTVVTSLCDRAVRLAAVKKIPDSSL